MQKALPFLYCLFLSSCSLIEITEPHQGADAVRLYDSYDQIENCQYIMEVIGTEGHWYNYLFISNRDLTQGAVNDLKNRIQRLGGNAAHVHTNMSFATSVTILAQAYECQNHNSK